MKYRVYDKSNNRIGYSDEPQYSGQAGLTHDYPIHCRECGKGIKSIGTSFARCENRHIMYLEEI